MKFVKFLEKVASTIKKHGMLKSGDTVLIGLSAGPDSVCLTRALKKLSPQLNLNLHAVYVDHGLRPGETQKEIAFCQDLCGSLDIPFSSREVDVKGYAKTHKLNKQEAARLLRYAVFEEEAFKVKAQRIAVGHNMDDQIETFLMRLMRGSGMKGLSGMPPVRGGVIRPLIEVKRSEIEAFLEDESAGFGSGTAGFGAGTAGFGAGTAGYMVDSSNLKEEYARNRLRSKVMPVLLEFNPNIRDTLSNTVRILGEEDRYLEVVVTKTLMRLISRKSEGSIELFVQPLETMDRVVLRRVLRRAIAETKGISGIGFVHVEDIINLIKSGRPGDGIDIPKGIRAVKRYSTLLLTSEPRKKLGAYIIEAIGEVSLGEGISIKAEVAGSIEDIDREDKNICVLDADKVIFPLSVRAREKGDYFYPSGFGKRKKLQDFFVDEKIPREERDTVPIVFSGEDLIWVAGMRADERFRPDDKTKNYLILSLKAI